MLPQVKSQFCFMYSDSFEYCFHFLPPHSQFSLLFPFWFVFWVWGNHSVCNKGEELMAVCFVSKMIYEIKQTNKYRFPSNATCFFHITQVTGFLCSLWWEHLGHQREVLSDIYIASLCGIEAHLKPLLGWMTTSKQAIERWLLGGFTAQKPCLYVSC